MNAASVLSFILFTVTVAIISWYKTRKENLQTSTGLFFANRNLGFLVVGGALFFTNISAVQFIGENELVYTNNMSVMAWGLSSVFAMLLVSEFIMPVYLRSGISTTPDFLEERYDAGTKRFVSIIFLVSYIVNMLPSVLYSGAIAFNGLFHVSETFHIGYWQTIWLLVWLIGFIGCLYTVLGGLKAVAISDTVLGVAMFAGGMVLPYLGLKYLGHGSVAHGFNTLLTSHNTHLNAIGGPHDAVPFATIFTGMLLVNLYYWGTEQYIVQQALASRNLAESQKGIAVASLGKIISPLLLNIPGLIAVQLYTHLHNTAEVFPQFVSDVCPPVLTGYMAAITFGAALTTFNAGLNSTSTLFVLNLYKPLKAWQQKPVTERQLVNAGKRFELLVCFLAMIIAPFIAFAKQGLYTYLQMVSGFFSVPIFTILVVGLVHKRVPAIAAKIGLTFFILTYAASQLFIDTGLHFLHVLAILFVLTVLLMLAIGAWRPMPVPFVQQWNNVVDLQPWKYRHLYAVLLIIAMIGVFVLFSPWGLAR
ncbi:solute:Na+ symporter, SSS family [Chitinophaga costaii]|uniref:Solute:Na+ symporter, SSS family n=1 Tax=Chitinophaga costaii TaxID=1335309 RepID=A0A1C4D0E2_9BACT|nr:solute:sodium symporter family transporter [Chitinophaga costaii]PUZ24408.1 solute:sodium symporter family transporter [Chitinophaga costaii]SCC24813.1 solute:Na+ symporter, SSS family [Chitinophaga costaii]